MSVVTQPFHAAVNHLLEREPWARAQLEPYAGKRARLNAPPFFVVVRVTAAGLLEAAPAPAGDLPPVPDDVTITVLPDAVAAVLRGGPAAAMKHVRIAGDAEFAAVLGQLAENLRWDPEEDLARWLGDAPAYRIARTARAVAGHAQRASRGLLESVAEYLLDENPQLVRHRMVEDFGREVAVLREDAERLEKRLDRLEQGARDTRGRP
ncbi:sterol-binding protein [Robbsia sp. Bb-Pol-6]|uniref:Ubiquinone biosynthesis accessory factor UbiJ n=1 Tax=Robbsia betulipollinis TaxID=2981849 RepID=A0ABT3ZLN1_9BURK|nr:SCP2 sterol-binding domain-containing protein [Robbsia betulipollinis]MCY0387322.1 sterol-binding protein [Robbsia betulipollinis]